MFGRKNSVKKILKGEGAIKTADILSNIIKAEAQFQSGRVKLV